MTKRIVKKKMPCVVLHNMAILPGMVIHFDLNNPYSVKAIEKAMLRDHKLFAVSSKGTANDGDTTQLHEYGSIVLVKQVIKMPNNVVRVLVEGTARAKLFEVADEEYNVATIKEAVPNDDWTIGEAINPVEADNVIDEIQERIQIAGKISVLRDILVKLLNYNPKIARSLMKQFEEAKTLSELLDCVAFNVPMDYADRQRLLESVSVSDRFIILMSILKRNVDVLDVKSSISKQIKERVEKNQKDYVLREQMKIIKKELGEEDGKSDSDEYKAKVNKLKASKTVKDKIIHEIDRYSRLVSGSSEAEVSRGYIETLIAMPWDKVSKDNKDLKHAEEILDDEHYGLEKVKERMLEFLAVRNLTQKGDSPIVCLVGPPGTGKTSIAKSVARALDKKYVRICLGGVRDEAEIRGHRRTYVGAMPGRIAVGIKNAGVKNPLMLLDEIDKMSSDHRGDTASALLEVLDPEQNVRFSDHYIEIPMDLSEVLFIATANSVSDIPKPLRDRMEIIEVSSYTENEKIHIAREHLLMKQIQKHGLTTEQLTIAASLWPDIVSGYTREAGVRELERKIAAICRKAARQIYQDGKKSVKINKSNLELYLGKRRYEADSINDSDEVGIARGLAWTSVGGDTLSIEVNIMPGKGELTLTGQLGDVMKESAVIGMSFVRSIVANDGIDAEFFAKNDFHIHVPEGSVPKDGPSAGITMATALYSAITKKKICAEVAMTGEVTLRGKVLPIGGLKEKLLAAKNAGVKKVLVPKKNTKDVEEIDEEIKKGLKIVFVESMDEVLKEALV